MHGMDVTRYLILNNFFLKVDYKHDEFIFLYLNLIPDSDTDIKNKFEIYLKYIGILILILTLN